jgi:hypothetical protein
MIFSVTMKTADALHYAIEDSGLDKNNDEDLEQIEKFKECCDKWFKYSENITLKIDTELETCTVVERKND